MKGDEIVRQIDARRGDDHRFVRWWRREEDWLDFELLDTFVQNIREDEEIEGFALLGMDEMWEYVRKVAGSRVERGERDGEAVVTWRRKSGRVMTCPFTPESLIRIFDVETRGNYIDG